MTIDTLGSVSSTSGFDPIVYARTTCGDTASEVGCDDSVPPAADTITFDVIASKPYYVFVDGWGHAGGEYQVNVAVIPAACGNGTVEGAEQCDDHNTDSGDGCSGTCQIEAGAPTDTCPGGTIVLQGSGSNPRTGTASGSTAYATPGFAGTCGNYGADSKDVVFAVTSDIDGTMTVNLGGPTATSYDSVLYVRKSCGDPNSELACDDATADGGEVVKIPVVAHVPYYIVVDGYGGASGNFQVHVQVDPASCGNGIVDGGEDCDDGGTVAGDGCSLICKYEPAGPEDVCPGRELTLIQNGFLYTAAWTGSTVNQASDYAGTCGTSGASKDAVAHFKSGPGGVVEISLSKVSTNFDAVLYVRGGDCATGAQVACDDVTGQGGDTVQFDAQPNTDYWVFVDGYNGAAGVFGMSLTMLAPACGNGKIEAGEQCDDGGKATGDGCGATCSFEGVCGTLAEVEPNPFNAPQVIPAACGSFKLQGATMPQGDADYFQVSLPAGANVEAWTFSGTPGACAGGADTVLSLWKAPIPAGIAESGNCSGTALYLACNDEDSANSHCSHFTHTVAVGAGGLHVLKVHNYYNDTPIDQYGLLVMLR